VKQRGESEELKPQKTYEDYGRRIPSGLLMKEEWRKREPNRRRAKQTSSTLRRHRTRGFRLDEHYIDRKKLRGRGREELCEYTLQRQRNRHDSRGTPVWERSG